MSPAINKGSGLQCFEHSDLIEIGDEIIFHLHSGLQHIAN